MNIVTFRSPHKMASDAATTNHKKLAFRDNNDQLPIDLSIKSQNFILPTVFLSAHIRLWLPGIGHLPRPTLVEEQ